MRDAADATPVIDVPAALAELGALLDRARTTRSLPYVPAIATEASAIRSALLERFRTWPQRVAHHDGVVDRWHRALCHGDGVSGAAYEQLRADHRTLVTLAAALWPREGR
jgi:hypothetical protein